MSTEKADVEYFTSELLFMIQAYLQNISNICISKELGDASVLSLSNLHDSPSPQTPLYHCEE